MKAIGLILLTVCGFAYSQPPKLNVDEQFDDNSLLWEEMNSGGIHSKVENGVYKISNVDNTASRFFWKDFIIDETQNFIIEARIKSVGGDDNRVGLVWNTSGWKNSNFLCFSGNQNYVVSQYVNGAFKDIIPWKKDADVVSPTGEYNVLSVQKINKKLILTINNKEVLKLDYSPFVGTKFGFFLSKEMAAEVDYLRIYQHGDARINLIDNPINGYVRENLGPAINGEKSDRSPLISPDGRTLYFIKDGYSFNVGSEKKSDVFFSRLNEDGEWSEAQSIGAPINNTAPNLIVAASSDNQTLYVSNLYKEDGTPNGAGVSITSQTLEGWEMPKKVEIINHQNKNTYANYCFSSDNKVLISSVERDDSYGDLDLYVSFLQEDGSYSEPKNMGNVINTKYADGTQFLAADNKTMFFYSEGHPGYGSGDIYVTERLDDTWLNWSKPKNMGPEINTGGWDAYFTVPAKGDYAYMVTSNALYSMGSEDIVRIKLAASAKPKPVLLVKGTVINAKTNEPILGSSILIQNLESGEQIGSALSDKKNGGYQITLPSETNYGFLAEKEGFYAVSDNLDLRNLEEYGEITKNLYMQPIEKGEAIRLNNVFFDTDKSDLRAESNAELNRLVVFLIKNQTVKITIEGHTDSQGNAAYNLNLSKARAKSVMDYLLAKGIDVSRLESQGFGLTKPVASNDTEEGRQKNRRVEFRILEK